LLTDDQVLDLAAHRIDLALRASEAPLPDTSYRASLLIHFHHRLYAAPEYIATGLQPETPEELATHAWVGGREAAGGARRLVLWNDKGRSCELLLVPPLQRLLGCAPSVDCGRWHWCDTGNRCGRRRGSRQAGTGAAALACRAGQPARA